MRCYSILYKDHVTSEEACAKIQQAIGPHEDLLTIVKRRKLKWYGHVSRSSGLAKTILQGTVKGGRRQGRRKKRWEDNIREWTGLEFARSQRRVENREKWRKLVVKSVVVPRRLPRLRDRWRWSRSDRWVILRGPTDKLYNYISDILMTNTEVVELDWCKLSEGKNCFDVPNTEQNVEWKEVNETLTISTSSSSCNSSPVSYTHLTLPTTAEV